MISRRFAIYFVLFVLSLQMLACSTKEEVVKQPSKIVSVSYVEKAEQPPDGVVRYCWEEPITRLEPHGPGVGIDGNWYHPAYMAKRQVREGRWRPCSPPPYTEKVKEKH